MLQYNTSCSFRCAEGFRLKGADMAQCTDLGQWTAPAPVCAGTVTSEYSFCVCQFVMQLAVIDLFIRHSLRTISAQPFVPALGWNGEQSTCSLRHIGTQGEGFSD